MVNFMFKKTLVKDDYLFIEKDEADCVYYIDIGQVAMLHKQSYTFLTTLNVETTFGEIGVFRNDKRLLTARAMDFTNVYYIKKDHLFKIIKNFTKAFQWVHKIQKDLK